MPTPTELRPRVPVPPTESCQSSAFFCDISTVVTSISTSFCGTSSFSMRLEYIGMRAVESRTITALRRFSARIIGFRPELRTASALARSSGGIASSARFTLPSMISLRSVATPLIWAEDSGLETEKFTSSAHV